VNTIEAPLSATSLSMLAAASCGPTFSSSITRTPGILATAAAPAAYA
jgi:hypothetical protein